MEKQQALEILSANKDGWFNDDSGCTVIKGSDIRVEDQGLIVGDMSVGRKAINKLMNRMGLNDKFMDYRKEGIVESARFNKTLTNIVDWNKDRKLIGYKKGNTIVDIIPCNPAQDFQKNLYLDTIYNQVRESIELLPEDKYVDVIDIDQNSKEMKISLVSPGTKFSMLQNDEWVAGSLITAGLSGVSYSPHYGRLVCTNGMVDGFKMRSTVANGKNHNRDVIKTYISRGFRMHDTTNEHLQKIGRDAISTPASLEEYLSFRKITKSLLSDFDDDQKEMILDKIFNLSEANEIYKTDVTKKSKIWLTSALCGLSVYELLNDITKFTTHDRTLNDEDSLHLNKEASKWFLGGEWHNNDVAPRVNFSKKPTYNDSVVT